MLFRMTRTQTGAAGTYRAGVAYDATGNANATKDAQSFIKAGFAEQVTAAQLEKEKAVAEALAKDENKPAKGGDDRAALKAAMTQLDQAQAEIETLKARVVELEAAANSKPAEQPKA